MAVGNVVLVIVHFRRMKCNGRLDGPVFKKAHDSIYYLTYFSIKVYCSEDVQSDAPSPSRCSILCTQYVAVIKIVILIA